MAYIEILEIHIDTKSGNEPLHRKTLRILWMTIWNSSLTRRDSVDLVGMLGWHRKSMMPKLVEKGDLTTKAIQNEWSDYLRTENLVSGQIDNLECMIERSCDLLKE